MASPKQSDISRFPLEGKRAVPGSAEMKERYAENSTRIIRESQLGFLTPDIIHNNKII
jgi:hypothetical protein